MSTIIAWLIVFLTVLSSLSFLIVSIFTGVPTLSSSKSEAGHIVALLKLAGLPERAVIVDLGSGWGSLVVALARAFPDASVQGVEISPFPYVVSRLRTHRLPNVSLRWGNFFHSDLKNADAVTCYLMPGSMDRVRDLLDRSIEPGTYVVSNTFLFRDRTISAGYTGTLRGTVALYRWPARHWIVGRELESEDGASGFGEDHG